MNKTVTIKSTSNNHIVKDGVVYARPAMATPNRSKDNRLFLSYNLGMDLHIPGGVIALIMPPNEASHYSVTQTGMFVLTPGEHKDITIEYKINTDAIPRVFEQEEICAQIVFVSTGTINFDNIVLTPVKDGVPEMGSIKEEDLVNTQDQANHVEMVDPVATLYTSGVEPNQEIVEA